MLHKLIVLTHYKRYAGPCGPELDFVFTLRHRADVPTPKMNISFRWRLSLRIKSMK